MWTEWLARTLRPRRDEAADALEATPRPEQRRAAAPQAQEAEDDDDRALLVALED
jgi:hypothetical protein